MNDVYGGQSPDSLAHGYECERCGHTPTLRELNRGVCPPCFARRRAKADADASHGKRDAAEVASE